MNKILLIAFILSIYEFIKCASIFFNEDKVLTSAGHTYLALSFVIGLLSGLQLFGIYDFLKLLN